MGRSSKERKVTLFFYENSSQARKDDSFIDKITSLFAPAFFFSPSSLLRLTIPLKWNDRAFSLRFFMKDPLASLLHFIKSSDFFVSSMLDYTLFHFSSFSFPPLFFCFSFFPFLFFFFWESFRSSSFNGRYYISWNIKERTRLHLYKQR